MAALGKAIEFDESKLNAFMGKAVVDLGAALHAALVVVGDKLGLYKAMAGAGWLTSSELAAKTSTAERYIREWLNANAASGYVTFDPDTQRYQLPPEQAFALTVQDLPGAFHIISSCFKDEPKITQAFRTGEGVGWHEHDANLYCGTERFFRPNYANYLITSWIPALDGVGEKLNQGATVADVGCGHGASTILMAQAFPKSRFSTITVAPSSMRATPRAATDCGSKSPSRLQAPKTIRTTAATTWSRSSIACTTWAIPRAAPATCSPRSSPVEHG